MNDPTAKIAKTTTPRRVFIVEADAASAKSDRARLAALGHVICGSSTRDEAASSGLGASAPEVLLIDAGRDGLTKALEAARGLAAAGDCPAVVLAAEGDDAIPRDAGPVCVLTRPFGDRELDLVIQLASHKRRADRRSSDILGTLLKSMPDAVTILDEKTGLAVANDQFFEFFGVDKAAARASANPIQFAVLDLARRGELGPGDPEAILRQRVDYIAGRLAKEGAFSDARRLSNGRCFESRHLAIEGGGRLALYRDVTDAKKREAELESRADMLRTVFSNMSEGISVVDGQLRLIAWNERLPDMVGVDPSIMRPGVSIRDMLMSQAKAGEFGPCDPEVEVDRRIGAFWPDRPIVMERRRPDGRSVQMRRSPVAEGGFVTIYVDVTEMRNVQSALADAKANLERRVEERTAELAESEARFRVLAEAAPVGIYRVDPNGRRIFVNPAFCKLAGVTREQALTDPRTNIVHPDDRQRVMAAWNAMVEGGPPYDIECRARSSNGRTTWVHSRAEPERAADGSIKGYIGTATDITERKKIEMATQALLADVAPLRGAVFFEATVRRLAATLEADVTFVTRFDPQRPDRLESFVAVEDGALVENQTFMVDGTPSAEVLQGRPFVVATGAAMRYPRDAYLARKRIDSYAGVPLTDDAGAILGHVGVMRRGPIRDETTLLTILKMFAVALSANLIGERSERQYRDLFEFSPSGIVMVDRGGRITLANRQAERLFGRAREDMIGQPVEILVPEDARGGHGALRRAFQAQPIIPRMAVDRPVLRGLRKDGSTFPAEIDLAPVVTVSGPMIAAAIRDVADRQRMEAERQARAMAEQANAAKNQFLSQMSHELRTPLNAVLGFAQLLELDPLMREQVDNVGQILKAGRHLVGLIDEVLDIARIESGQIAIALEPVVVVEILDEAVALARPLAEKRSIGIAVDMATAPGASLSGDRQRLRQVLLNLLSNAIKYNRPGGTVRVRARDQGDDRLRIEVEDTGPGIAADLMPRLFASFDRLGADPTIEGAGLGLAISKGLIEAMGGRIGATSVVGVGSLFWIELGRAPSAESRAEPGRPETPDPRPAATRRRVLHVEDNPANLKLVEHILRRRPHLDLLSAAQGGIALDLARHHRPAAILLDVNLPDMDGATVLKTLKRDERTRDIPVIVISADAIDAKRKVMFDLGAAAYVTKPFDIQALLRVIDDALQ